MSPELDDRELSPPRVAVAVLLLLAAAFGALVLVRHALAATPKAAQAAWYAPYVDATLPPAYQFQDPGSDPARAVVLGFVVSTPGAPCQPSWGAVEPLTGSGVATDLERRIARLQQAGGTPIVSFGGQRNDEPAVGCSSEPALERAYRLVVDRYRLTTIDFDLEGAALGDAAANARRAAAVASLQHGLRSHGRKLAVWLTLPTGPSGLTPEGVGEIDTMIAAGVDLAGVNLLAMDFTPAPADSSAMWETVQRAATAAQRQILTSYTRARIRLTTAEAWAKLGLTPMIGVNDDNAGVFDLQDARELLRFAQLHRIGRVSIWSLNRDTPCGPNVVSPEVVSNYCSGLGQDALAFSRVLDKLTGRPSAAAAHVTVERPLVADDPRTSPYPIWDSSDAYPGGYKVVWHGSVYRAKYYNQGYVPDAPVAQEWSTPWLLLGPVLPGEHAPTIPTLPRGTYPAWSPRVSYRAGTRVLFHGLPYEAKWYTVGDTPEALPTVTPPSPWQPLFTIPGEPPPHG
ncbi:MAG: glycosyl hydrolase family 18 [Actinobacteria bacterium]|nr:glycosyl hydrolase family 18 [Actinomycetota bacterium]